MTEPAKDRHGISQQLVIARSRVTLDLSVHLVNGTDPVIDPLLPGPFRSRPHVHLRPRPYRGAWWIT